MESIEKNLNIGRNKMIALSLLCGCDYDEKGVSGIGKETAMKFLQSLNDDIVINRYFRTIIFFTVIIFVYCFLLISLTLF